MRVLTADCSAIYSGRGDTTLARGIRAIFIKEDGSVSIHNEVGNKPLNYMKCAVFTQSAEDDLQVWTFDTRHESLRIELHQIISDFNVPLIAEDPGLVRDGTENQLQEWLAANVYVLGEGYTLVQREYPTGNGPVDLLVRNAQGAPVAVEVKRVAMLGAVDQVRRYVDALKVGDFEGCEETTGLIAALDVRPRTSELALKRGISTVTIPATWRYIKEQR